MKFIQPSAVLLVTIIILPLFYNSAEGNNTPDVQSY